MMELVVKLAKLCCELSVQSIGTCLELLRFALCLHFGILWRLAICFLGLFSLPARALAALYTQRLVEMQLHTLKTEGQKLLWDRKELEERLLVAIDDRKMMESMLIELEQQYNEAILKIELLQGEVQDLKAETHRLKEVQGKALWGYNDCNILSWKPDYNNTTTRQVSKVDQVQNCGVLISSLAEQREVALSRSVFSAILSVVVGVVLFEAEERCMPLVVALFTVVAISLVSVVQTFTRIEQKHIAFEVVVLMSINWFILGTLVCPMLPILLPLAFSFWRRTF